jgi:hypothetical protein
MFNRNYLKNHGLETGRFANALLCIHFASSGGQGKAEAQIVVAITRIVVVAIRHTAIPRIVVPTAPAIYAVTACPKPVSVV